MTIHPLSALSRADLALAGGKGANLGELTRLGLAVPPGFVVSALTYRDHARAWRLAEHLAAHLAAHELDAASERAAEHVRAGAIEPEVERAIRAAYREMGAPAVAVRSSATAEDLADASFAGQHDTFLDVSGEDALIAALRDCWASLWTPRALRYRAERGIDHHAVDIAVVVQRMVPAEFAGVLFTVDPVAQRADRMLLEVAPGLGEAIVSGAVRGDVYRIGRAPFAGDGAKPSGDVAIEDRDPGEPGRAEPGDEAVLELARLGLKLEAHFGCPQDVEFAIAGGAIHVLQSRPITTLDATGIEPMPPPRPLSPMQKRMVEGTDNGDRFPVAPKPLDGWFMRTAVPGLINAMRYLGFRVDPDEEREVLETVWREYFVLPTPRPSLALLGLPAKVSAGLRRDMMAWWEGEPLARLLEVSAPVDLRALDDAALMARADRLFSTTHAVLLERFQNMASSMVAMGLLRLPVTAAVGRARAAMVLGDLFSGVHTRTSETNLALYRLARRAADAGPEVTGPIRAGKPGELGASAAGRAFLAEAEAFLAEHGYRESTGLYISAPTWRQDPTPMWGALASMLDATEPPSERAGFERHRVARAEVARGLRFVPGLPGAFERVLDRVRAAIAYRERSHFDLTRPLAALQAVVAEAARRLVERGLLAAADDVFYLTESELRAWMAGNTPARDEARRLIRRRRATYAVVNAKWQRRAFGAGASAAGDELRGTGASSGVVRARARIVRDATQFGRLQRGEVLVCPYTNPAWTPLFALAAGVVTETGGPGSHAAIVAREYGIPAVLGARGATERIRDGQEVLVDGTEGRVALVRAPAAATA